MRACNVMAWCGFVGLVLAGAASAQPSASCRANAQFALDAYVHGHYQQALTVFAPSSLPPGAEQAISDAWTSTLAAVGPFRGANALYVRELDGDERLVAALDFAKLPMAQVISCNAQGLLVGFRLIKATALPVLPPSDGSTTGLARALQIPTPQGPLSGILVSPRARGRFPVVLLLAGSGANDRDETVGPNKPLRDLAEGLAAAGIASLRYDKRTFLYGRQMSNVTVDQEVTDDAVTALRLLRQQPEVDVHRVFLLGHSLGAAMAPRVAMRSGVLAGIVLMAAPRHVVPDTVLRQVRYIAGTQGLTTAQLQSTMASLLRERDLIMHADPAYPPAGELLKAPLSWWLSLRDYDPIATARPLHAPMLLVQGASDYQVWPQDDFAAWKAAFVNDPQVKFIEYPGLGHEFMPAGTPPSPDDYFHPGHVDPRVIADIANWIKAQRPRS